MTDKKQGKELRIDNLVKIPYFDEEAAQDYLDMCNGGHLDWSTDENKERLGKIIGEIEAEVGGGINVLVMLKAAFQGKGDMGYSSIVSKVVDSKLQNTLLTDYLARANGDDNVYKFESVTVAPYPNSFTMYNLFTGANGVQLMYVDTDFYEKLTEEDVAKQIRIVIGVIYLSEAKKSAAHEVIKQCFKKLLKQTGVFSDREIELWFG